MENTRDQQFQVVAGSAGFLLPALLVGKVLILSMVVGCDESTIFHGNAPRHRIPYVFGCDETGTDTRFCLSLRTFIMHRF